MKLLDHALDMVVIEATISECAQQKIAKVRCSPEYRGASQNLYNHFGGKPLEAVNNPSEELGRHVLGLAEEFKKFLDTLREEAAVWIASLHTCHEHGGDQT